VHRNMQTKCLAIKSVLVLPEYWGTGISLMLFSEMLKRAQEKGYQWIDLSITSADNPKTPMLAERMGGEIYKRYRVYKKMV
jgi:GNAT superfamily N-acetyltransferase